MEQIRAIPSGCRCGVAVVGLLLALFAALNLAAAEPTGDKLSAAREQIYTAYSAQLRVLANQCDAQGLPKQAEFTRQWLPERDSTMLYVFTLPASSAAPASLVQSSLAQKWWQKFMEARAAEAEKLFSLAQAAMTAKQYALAFELARETVRENPDHAAARHVLGDRKAGDGWVSPEAARRLEAGQVWSEQFGWLPAERLKQYQSGERFYRGEWISAADDARFHSNIRNGWTIESDHYSVVTNNSLESGAQLAAHLEVLYQVWRQAFVGYYATPAQVEHWFAAAIQPPAASPTAAHPTDEPQPTASPTSSGGEYFISPTTEGVGSHKLHQVLYFHDRQQYIEALHPSQPQIQLSIGFYSDNSRTAYFFASDDPYPGTLYHEATHQLFRETPPATVDPGRKNNFWIVESIAVYMESFAEHRLLEGESYGSYITVGGKDAGRASLAHVHVVDDGFYVPLRELASLSMLDFQHQPQIKSIYSQIAGQALFFMHADGARYRPALMNYLLAVYTGRASPDTLERLTGQKFEQLDQQYRQFMQ
ncbi:MAG TPA: hypothetical protein VFE46_05835 [Pirellulales bacterium]|jgi:hypothetical protein|nr:hypothetical protein [Pirellulales bacterium]